ncbi:hypothetical protein JOD43_003773 [Pullulanibacillus pueri]|nr:hypothetical protein [Pullulanibacillus pueri]
MIATSGRSLSSGSQVDLRTRAVPKGARAPSVPINWVAAGAFWD